MERTNKGLKDIQKIRPKLFNRITLDITKNKVCYFLALPAIIYTIIFGYLTLPYIVIAFQRFNYRQGIFKSEFTGLENFQVFFKSKKLIEVTMNTLSINFLSILIGAILAIFLAVILNEMKNRLFVKVNQSLFIFPYFLSWVIVSYLVYSLFANQIGIVNQILKSIGLETVNWYTLPKPWLPILVVMRIWKGTGIQVVILLSAIAGFDKEIYEAATIDGASRWEKIKRITIPLLMPTVMITTLMSLGRIFYGDFGMIYSIIRDNALLYPTADVIDTYVFRLLRKTGDPSQAMAIGLYQSLLGFITVYGVNALTRKFFPEGAIF